MNEKVRDLGKTIANLIHDQIGHAYTAVEVDMYKGVWDVRWSNHHRCGGYKWSDDIGEFVYVSEDNCLPRDRDRVRSVIQDAIGGL